MKRSKKIYLGAAVLAVVILAALVLKGGGTRVETVQVKKGNITRTVTDTGYVQPSSNHDLYAAQAGRIVHLPVKTGQAVKKGETMALLENPDLEMQINDATWQLTQAGATVAGTRASVDRTALEIKNAGENLARTEQLYQAGAVTRAEYEKALLLVETLRQSLNEQNSRLEGALAHEAGLSQSLRQLSSRDSQMAVTSPADGTVLSLPAQLGQWVNPGSLLASVAATHQIEVKADILSDDLAEINEGQRVIITAPVLGQKTLVGQVKQIYPKAEEKLSALGVIQRRVPVIISLDDPGNLRPGFEVRVAVETKTRQSVPVVPREAVRTMADGRKEVMVVSGERVIHRTISTGISDRYLAEVTGGLEDGEEIIRDGSLDLKEKAKVKR